MLVPLICIGMFHCLPPCASRCGAFEHAACSIYLPGRAGGSTTSDGRSACFEPEGTEARFRWTALTMRSGNIRPFTAFRMPASRPNALAGICELRKLLVGVTRPRGYISVPSRARPAAYLFPRSPAFSPARGSLPGDTLIKSSRFENRVTFRSPHFSDLMAMEALPFPSSDVARRRTSSWAEESGNRSLCVCSSYSVACHFSEGCAVRE